MIAAVAEQQGLVRARVLPRPLHPRAPERQEQVTVALATLEV